MAYFGLKCVNHVEKKENWPSRENLLLKLNNKMDLPMSCLSSTTRNTGQGQAQHSNINASSDGSNNNNNSGNCCFGSGRSQTRLPYWPSPTTISGRGRGSEGKVGGERARVGKKERGKGRGRHRASQSRSPLMMALIMAYFQISFHTLLLSTSWKWPQQSANYVESSQWQQ